MESTNNIEGKIITLTKGDNSIQVFITNEDLDALKELGKDLAIVDAKPQKGGLVAGHGYHECQDHTYLR